MKWINCEERLPKHNDEILVFCDDGIVTARFNKKGKHFYWSAKCCCIHEVESPFNVTHWMDLPEPPKD